MGSSRIAADTAALYRVFLGTMGLVEAEDEGRIRVDGPPALVRSLRTWFRIR